MCPMCLVCLKKKSPIYSLFLLRLCVLYIPIQRIKQERKRLPMREIFINPIDKNNEFVFKTNEQKKV